MSLDHAYGVSTISGDFGRQAIFEGQVVAIMFEGEEWGKAILRRVVSWKLSGRRLTITLENMDSTFCQNSPSPKTADPENDGSLEEKLLAYYGLQWVRPSTNTSSDSS
jgi:hypothetical protein